MKILLINLMLYTTQPGYADIPRKKTIKNTMIYNFIKGFYKNGHSVTLVAGEPFSPLYTEKYQCEIIWLPLGFRKILPNGLMYPVGLYSYLKKNHKEYDLIISSDVFSFCSLFASMVCPEKLLIWHEPGKYHDKFFQLPARLWYNIPVRIFMKNKVVVIARSEVAKSFISRYCNCLSPEYIDHGIDLDIFYFSEKKEKYLMVVAQLIPRKCIDTILRKFSDFIKKYNSEYTLYIAGDGPEREKLEDLTKQLGISDNVCFAGFLMQPQLVERLSHASGILIDSQQEFSMVSIPESIVCGTPVLTNSVPYPAAYVKSDSLGIVKDNWNADDILMLLNHQKEFTENCRKRRPYMSNQYLAKHMLELYENLKK